MLRQPMQRFTQMQASDIDIYRNEIRKTKNEIVSVLYSIPANAQVSVTQSVCSCMEPVSLPRLIVNYCASWDRHCQSVLDFVLNRVLLQVRLLGEHTDHEPEEIEKTISRPKYFDPYEAVKYGIIDRVSCLCLTMWMDV